MGIFERRDSFVVGALSMTEGLTDSPSDEVLMTEVAAGSTHAYGQLVDRHARRYRALAYRFLMNEATADDCLQDCFIALWQKPQRFDATKARFTTWFHRIVVNRALDIKRRRTLDSLPEDSEGVDANPTVEQSLVEREKWQSIIIAIDRLSDRQAAALRLTYFDGLANQEAADVLDMNIKAFESLLLRARSSLKKQLVDG